MMTTEIHAEALTTPHRREETIGTGHLLITSCSCGWTAQTESWRHDKRSLLAAAFKAHKAEAK